ncbi:kinase-like protein, partial [Ramicandelaber brevisporus]
ELERVQRLFPGLDEQFILLGKLGEGTFSTVYRAVDIRHNEYEQTEWQKPGQSPRYVAVKNVFAMSSPQRIANEIRIVKQLGQHEGIVSLITALRHQDHVIIVLPLLEYDDFRHYYNCMSVQDLQNYFRSLFSAVAHCHKFGVMHRDIKPSNFLYSVRQGRGVLVDFGLAETVDDMDRDIAATERSQLRQLSLANTQHASAIGRSKDLRPAFHANRAGTRGFRPPEVLLKVPRQSPLIDVWAVGVTLLVFMTKRFPFFNSYDDQEALLELAVLFGTDEIQDVARFHGRLFYSNVPTLRPKRTDFRKIVLAYNSRDYSDFPPELFDLLSKCMELRTDRRISAAQALEHPFLR